MEIPTDRIWDSGWLGISCRLSRDLQILHVPFCLSTGIINYFELLLDVSAKFPATAGRVQHSSTLVLDVSNISWVLRNLWTLQFGSVFMSWDRQTLILLIKSRDLVAWPVMNISSKLYIFTFTKIKIFFLSFSNFYAWLLVGKPQYFIICWRIREQHFIYIFQLVSRSRTFQRAHFKS